MPRIKKVKKEEVVEPAVELAVEIKPVEPKVEEKVDKRSELQKVWDTYKAQYPEKAAYKEKLYAEGLAPNSILSKLNQ